MIKYNFLVLAFFSFFFLDAQTNLSGVVNIYSGLLSQDNCANTITLDNADDFSIGMGIVIIQMNGAGIETSNNDNFGNLTNLNGAGLYEYNQIVGINGQSIILSHSLQNTYSAANTQVVGFEIHIDAIVSSEVTAPAWNGNTGGIIVIETENNLTIQADINANGLGFRGGLSYIASDDNCNFITFSNNFSYENNNWRGAPKGEGVAAFVSGHELGLGAQANGGGGGNSHNSGGGGGALHTTGGLGGTNNEPSTFGCKGNFPGRGGKSLLSSSARIFLGGGGGSGHSNNNAATRGGFGGGIIILRSPSISFTSGQITANGQAGDSTTGDGGGGGGSGGSIIIESASINGIIPITAQGGNGGNTDNDGQNRCFGPGGGGGGGLLMTNQGVIAQLDGGIAGQSLNSTACSGSNGALAGSAGIVGNNFSALVQGNPFTAPAILSNSSDTIACVGESISLFAELAGENLDLQWQILNNGQWNNILDAITDEYTLIVTENASYRLSVSPQGDCFDPFFSTAIDITLAPIPIANPSFIVDGFDVQFMANTQNATTINWIFLPEQTSDEINPNFNFIEAGIYEVLLETSNDCGLISTILTVEIASPLFAQFSSTSLSGCAPLSILFTDESVGQIDQRLWTFTGGVPAMSTEANPLIQFPNIGTFEVNLVIENSGNNSSNTTTITVLPPPLPDFSFETDGLSVQFTNLSENADDYIWNFGDSENSTLESPLHTYASSGTYEVTLNAVNEFCATAFSQTIGVNITNTIDIKDPSIDIYPNPSNGFFQIKGITQGQYQVFNLDGVLVLQNEINSNETRLDLSAFSAGVYLIFISNQEQFITKKLIKY